MLLEKNTVKKRQVNNDKNGFQKTQQWLIKREILKLELRKQLEFQKIQHEQNLYNNGRGRYKNLSRLQLFRTHEQRLKKIKDPDLLEAYYLSFKQIPNLKNSQTV